MDGMEWLLIATGFTGALSLLYLLRAAHHAWMTPPSLEAHFSPKGGCTDAIVREIQHARHEILVLAYSFTSKPIAQALVDAKLRGVHVDIVLDHSNEKEEYTDLHFFLQQGLHPVIDPHHAIAHNKVMVIDNRTLLTGSFNFTQRQRSFVNGHQRPSRNGAHLQGELPNPQGARPRARSQTRPRRARGIAARVETQSLSRTTGAERAFARSVAGRKPQ